MSLYQHADKEPLSLESRFTFHCHPGLACFNRCCAAPTILLSPYDILRLKNCLGIASGEFLRRYTCREIDPRSNLALIFMDISGSEESGCPFLSAGGCTVYPHRPAACRLFPLTMGSRLTEEGLVDYYCCRRLDYCQGFAAGAEWTVASWRADQGFEEYDRGRREWLEIILRQGQKGQVDARVKNLFTAMAYDLDKFRHMLREPVFHQVLDLDDREWASLELDDLALLQVSCRAIKALLFNPDATDRITAALP